MGSNNKKQVFNKMDNHNKRQEPNNNKDTKYNSVPSLVFTPFKISKNIVVVLSLLSLILTMTFGWSVNFEPKDLKEISQFSLNSVIVVGALMIAIFAIPIDDSVINTSNNKKEIILRFIGDIGILISAAIFCYVLSFIVGHIPEVLFTVPFFEIVLTLQQLVIKTFCICGIVLITNALSQTFATIVAYFNVRY